MIFEVKVEFNKDFLEVSENQIRIGLLSRPIKGQANLEIIKKLSKHFGLPPNKIRIIKGQKSKNKIIEILI